MLSECQIQLEHLTVSFLQYASHYESEYNEVTKIKEQEDMKMIKRFSLLSFVFILACSIVGCQQIDASQEQKQFDQFIQQEFVKTMENDYVALIYTCKIRNRLDRFK